MHEPEALVPAALVRSLHETRQQAVLEVAGAGTQAIAWLHAVGRSSRTVLEATDRYSSASLGSLLGEPPARTVSRTVAAAMAAAARRRARELAAPGVPVVGAACTAAIATDRPRRGAHRAVMAVADRLGVAITDLGLSKGELSRRQEEAVVSCLLVEELAAACGVPVPAGAGAAERADDAGRVDLRERVGGADARDDRDARDGADESDESDDRADRREPGAGSVRPWVGALAPAPAPMRSAAADRSWQTGGERDDRADRREPGAGSVRPWVGAFPPAPAPMRSAAADRSWQTGGDREPPGPGSPALPARLAHPALGARSATAGRTRLPGDPEPPIPGSPALPARLEHPELSALLAGAPFTATVRTRFRPCPALAALVRGAVDWLWLDAADGDPQPHRAGEGSWERRAIVSGAFNPLHTGHLGLAAAAAEFLDRQTVFELPLLNAEKAPLEARDVHRRAAQLAGCADLVLSRAPLFQAKAELFPGAVFVIGVDTAVRLVDPRFYDGSRAAMVRAIAAIARRGCSFLVAGRRLDGRFTRLADLNLPLPPDLQARFVELPPAAFRVDLSSTEIRTRRAAGTTSRAPA